MRGDFSRVTFDRSNHYSSVLTGQGQVLLDAPVNEQQAIARHFMRTLAADLIGPYGGPAGRSPFRIVALPDGNDPNLGITAGRYYVDGLMCEAERPPDGELSATFYDQPDRILDPERADDRLPDPPMLVYLRVWERHLTSIEVSAIREVALGDEGPEAGTRSKLVWQVFATDRQNPDATAPLLEAGIDKPGILGFWADWEQQQAQRLAPLLRARAKHADGQDLDPCITDPASSYRGDENQLYRVEIHTGGPVGQATFKWSRDNGSVTFAIESVSGQEVVTRSLGRDSRLGLQEGDWVEVVDDAVALGGPAGPLRRVTQIDALERQVTLDAPIPDGIGTVEGLHPLLRRWDYSKATAVRDGTDLGDDHAVKLVEAAPGSPRWLTLEDGVEVEFRQEGGDYTPGDFWLVPARTQTGDVEWPKDGGQPARRPPAGVEYRYAPLALVHAFDTEAGSIDDLRREFDPLAHAV
jgi:Family of unknown function (DUF6519)